MQRTPVAPPPEANTRGGLGWRDGSLVLKPTGVRVRLDRHLLAEAWRWLLYLALLAGRRASRSRSTTPRPRVWFTPQRPGPWYLARGAALWSGLRTARSAADADVAFYFEDVTQGRSAPCGLPQLNAGCVDVSKSRVAAVFEEVFGYPLALDPTTGRGLIVEKSETNGVHDGRLVLAPCAARPGRVYQRLVDASDDQGVSRDFRTLCAQGRPLLVWVKEKPAEARFSINNRRAALRAPGDIFSPEEIAAIGRFCGRMGLDWGGLDILRDRDDGRIYVVDVNKTDLGPVIALSWRDKILSMAVLAEAFERLVLASCAGRWRAAETANSGVREPQAPSLVGRSSVAPGGAA
jgi:hypothetical protein